MFNNTNYKKLSLYVILDAYVTKNAIVDFLLNDTQTDFKDTLVNNSENTTKTLYKINNYISYLQQELEDIELFLNDEANIHWNILGLEKEFFDKSLPSYKRKIEWFRSVDRYPFDYSIFFTEVG